MGHPQVLTMGNEVRFAKCLQNNKNKNKNNNNNKNNLGYKRLDRDARGENKLLMNAYAFCTARSRTSSYYY